MGVLIASATAGFAVVERSVDAAGRHHIQQIAGSEQGAYIDDGICSCRIAQCY
jgi:hypothetical protein